ncbi:MAG: hypothetical protein KAX20_00390 [Candidatus Omnitrophica bacterium]|nr:hypothetical protein [Candidatus Omnitrophota bacterium]
MWYKGYTHYHTSFHYPLGERITPEELAEDLKKLGATFVFCAGDHGDEKGNNYWGLDVREFQDYRESCLSINKDSDVILIPSPEIHLMFPPFGERHEHHSCVPILDYLPVLELPESRALAASYTREIDSFILECHRHNSSLTLNHPYLSVNSLFGGPFPINIPSLYEIDYLELYTIDHPDKFPYDLELYLKFLSHPISSMMACCAGVDNALTPCKLLSNEKRIVPSTYLYISENLTIKSLMEAYNERRSYVVYGDLYLEEIEPIPSKRSIKEVKNPVINLSVKNTTKKKITVEIYRNGIRIYEDKGSRKDKYHLNWEDKDLSNQENHYIIHIQAEEEHLITSPINYLLK